MPIVQVTLKLHDQLLDMKQLPISTNSWFYTIYNRCNRNNRLGLFAFELPFLYSSYNILFPYLQCLWPPIVYYQLVPHNTQTNKISYLDSQVFSKQSLQPLTNNDGIIPSSARKKLMTTQNKNLNPKTK
jgi:hypothetical protein